MTILVQARAWYFKLKTRSIEHLVVVEAVRCGIEADPLAIHGLVVARSLFVLFPDIRLINASDLVFDTKESILVVDVLASFTLCNNFCPVSTLCFQNTNTVILPVV